MVKRKKNSKFLSGNPTQHALAKRLGVSQMTISRVLNNRPGVGLKLKAKVLKEMENLDYVPNFIARGLVVKSTRIIGLVIPDITNSFFPDITKSIEMVARQKGYQVILAHSAESYQRETEELNTLIGLRVAGLIIAPTGHQKDVGIYQKLIRLKIPFVFIDRVKKSVPCSWVVTDTQKGALLLGRYLVQKGYRKWGYLRGPKEISSSEEHYRGLKESLKEAGLSPDIITVVPAGFFEEDGYRAVQELLRRTTPDVIIGINDPVAVGAYRFLKKRTGDSLPEMALVGFSNVKMVDIIESPLTTVREFPELIGKKAAELLFEEIRKPEQKKIRERVEPELVIRKSG